MAWLALNKWMMALFNNVERMAEPQDRATGQLQAAISAPSVTSRLRSYSLGTFLFPFKVCIYHQSTPLKCMHTALFLPKFPSASWSREQRLPLMCEHSEDPHHWRAPGEAALESTGVFELQNTAAGIVVCLIWVLFQAQETMEADPLVGIRSDFLVLCAYFPEYFQSQWHLQLTAGL